MTINQIIYNLRNLIKEGRSDDIKITDRQLEFITNYIRASLIKQDVDKGKTISSNVKQNLGIINFEKVDASNSNIDTGIKFLRSSIIIPKVLELNFKDAITYVGGIDRRSAFDFTTRAYADKQMDSKYGNKTTFAYLEDGYMYLLGCDLSRRKLTIEGIFENPRDVYNFKKEDDSPCYDPDTQDYPMSSYMIRTLNKLIISEDLSAFLQLQDDYINDASSEIKK